MLNICKNDKERVLKATNEGKIDAADIAYPNFIDEIVLKINNDGLLEVFEEED